MGSGRSARCRALLLLFALTIITLGAGIRAAAASETVIVVTSPLDALPDAACPDDDRCTLRAAIGAANAVPPDTVPVITFDPSVFDPAVPQVIALESQLPPVATPGTRIDGTGAGVVISGANLPVSARGLSLVGAGIAVQGLVLQDFGDACILTTGSGVRIGGDRELGEGNVLTGCGTGVLAAGDGTVIEGNAFGLDPISGEPEPLGVGVRAEGASVRIGGEPAARYGNSFFAAGTAVELFSTAEQTEVLGNQFGSEHAGVGFGVRIFAGSRNNRVEGNDFARVSGSGIAVLDDAEPPASGNSLRLNTYGEIGGLPIDLRGDGIRNENDPGDGDDGPNGMRNHPVITRATQARVEGIVDGCSGCTVDLYRVAHEPGGANDTPSAPVFAATTTTDSAGRFAFDSPAVTPGTWVAAMATDASGNSSEFGPSLRVGTGVVQCGAIELQRGWNLVGYFAPTTALGGTFPAGAPAPSPVTAIYRLVDGTSNFLAWFADSGTASTLSAVQTGEAYWFYARTGVDLPGTITLTAALPVTIVPGWNAFTYVGASGHVLDALANLDGGWTALYRLVNDGESAFWEWLGGPDTPDWARAATDVEACGAYVILATEGATLVPLQP